MKQRIEINQKENFAANFGIVNRSSAVFYYLSSSSVKTKISFMNYWKEKRGLDVLVVASLRNMSGKLCGRESLSFTDGDVINYQPLADEDFEGSVEIEIFSVKNMFIPYAAIIAYYETYSGIALVHSYARAYSRHEVEDKRTISSGEEGCWTLRDTSLVRSFCVFHNGPREVAEQTATLEVIGGDSSGRRMQAEIKLPVLKSYESIKIFPGDYFTDFAGFLGGKPGSANLSFQLGEGFTRMLVGTEAIDGTDMQVTHSNFNYSKHATDLLDVDDAVGYMYIPPINIKNSSVLVYPDSQPGNYSFELNNQVHEFSSGQRYETPCQGGMAVFRRTDGRLPSRIVTAIVGSDSPDRIPCEMSLGILTSVQPKKRLWWGPVREDALHSTALLTHALPEIYGDVAEGKIEISLYSSIKKETLKQTLEFDMLGAFESGLPLVDIFSGAREFLGDAPGYYTLYSDYPGFTVYSIIRKEGGSVCIEHGF